ncbi:MAG: flagellar basal body-associated FliL family protein [Paracoccaceae bacterium]
MRKLTPIFLILITIGAGIGAGILLRPAPLVDATVDPSEDGAVPHATKNATLPVTSEFVKLTNQFIVPVVENDRIASLVILSLSLEVTTGSRESVYTYEPKLRDGILQLLFDHANTGGFRGSFTDAANLVVLRKGLNEVSRRILGDIVKDVMITDIIRQDG